MKVVISQPMFLPWIGLFEQIKLSDVFVHYDDVALPQGRSFISRVQIKTETGFNWLTAPISRSQSRLPIKDVLFVEGKEWKVSNLDKIKHSYKTAPFFCEMFDLIKKIYDHPFRGLSEFNIFGIEIIAEYLGLKTSFIKSSDLNIQSSGSDKLLMICKHLGASDYITGHGALNYLNYQIFEDSKINVLYMDYKKNIYPQIHGEFTPFLSVIDAIANLGKGALDLLSSDATYWKEFTHE